MKTFALAAAMAALISGAAFAATSDEAQLRRIEIETAKAFEQNDVDWLDRNYYADDWVSNFGGGFFAKTEQLTDMREGLYRVKSMKLLDMRIRVVGGMAFIQGMDEETTVDEGKETSRTLTWLDVFERRNGRWICVASEDVATKPGRKLFSPLNPRRASH